MMTALVFMRNSLVLSAMCMVAVARAEPLVYAATPSGMYKGTKSVLGEHVDATLDVTDPTDLEFTISGVISLDCKEAFSMSGSDIHLTNINAAGDCTHDALQKEKVTLESVKYNSGADQITVTVKYSFLKIDVVLDKSSSVAISRPPSASPSLQQLVDRYYHVFATQQPLGTYQYTTDQARVDVSFINCTTMDISVSIITQDEVVHQCSGASYRRNGDMITLSPNNDCQAAAQVIQTSSVRYDPIADSIIMSALIQGVAPKWVELPRVVDADTNDDAEAPDSAISQLFHKYYHVFAQAAPAGTYEGSKTVLGEKVSATVKIDTSTTMDLTISGVISLSCTGEAYLYSGGAVTLPNAGNAGDCVHDALQQNHVSLEGIQYDTSADHITVKVKYSFLTISLELDHVSI